MSEQKSGAEEGPKAALGADLIIPVLAAAFTVYFLVTSSDLVWEARANGTVIGIALLVLIAVQIFRIATLRAQGEGDLSFGEFGQMSDAHWQRLGILLRAQFERQLQLEIGIALARGREVHGHLVKVVVDRWVRRLGFSLRRFAIDRFMTLE